MCLQLICEVKTFSILIYKCCRDPLPFETDNGQVKLPDEASLHFLEAEVLNIHPSQPVHLQCSV
jgi:hypothetical protein